MSEAKQNYYGELCTEMYEILHEKAPQDELDFYLSYAQREGTRAARQHRIWPRCTSSRGWKNGNGGVYDQHLGTVTGIFPLQVHDRAFKP